MEEKENFDPTNDEYGVMIVYELKDKMVDELKEKNNERDDSWETEG